MTISEPGLSAEVLHGMYSKHIRSYSTHGERPFLNYYIRLQVEGRCEAMIGRSGNWETVYPGDLFLFKPGDYCQLSFAPHKKTAEVYSGNYYFVCRGTWLDRWWNEAERPIQAKIKLDSKLLGLCGELETEMRKTKRNWAEAAGYLLRMLCIEIDRELGEPHAEARETVIAGRMKSYIEEHALTELSVKEVADHVGLSKSRASHLFAAVFRQSIIHCALEFRLNHARDLIRYSDYSLQQVAELSGFNQYSYFHRAFRGKYGVSPKQFR